METRISTGQFAVFDDVLSNDEFLKLHRYLEADTYTRINARQWSKGWRLQDGSPLGGSSFGNGEDWPDVLIPLRQKVLESVESLPEVVGKRGEDWDGVTASVMLYPAETGLSWHSDGARSGAYTFYAHPSWNVQWGGELIIADEGANAGNEKGRPAPYLWNTAENEALLNMAAGAYIPPSPNRLVIIGGGQLHKVALVNKFAGDNLRCSVSGFLNRKRTVQPDGATPMR